MQELVARLDDIGKPAWIALTVVSFILFWPWAYGSWYLIGSGRMACWSHRRGNRWQRRMERMQRRMERMQDAAGRWSGRRLSGDRAATAPLTNTATKPCSRLEEEQREFKEFLDRLRHAKDKAEFDQFMAERRPNGREEQPQTS